MRYSAFDLELIACVSGIHHFHYMLEGRPFTIYTVFYTSLNVHEVKGRVLKSCFFRKRACV